MDTEYHIKVVKDKKDELILDNHSQVSNSIDLVNDGYVDMIFFMVA